MERRCESVLVTGGCGFIGSNFIRDMLADPAFTGKIINLDALTYAGNLRSLEDVTRKFGAARYSFAHADICDQETVRRLVRQHGVDTIVHFAAESHVDRSIVAPDSFIKTNIVGTFTLLETVRQEMAAGRVIHLHHVSTDEVFGSLGETGQFREDTAYDPRSPYSASKASSDHLVRAYAHTYGISMTLSNCSNNYGPWQFPEKLIPVMILNMLEGKPLPVYGDGSNIRDWLYVADHNSAIKMILRHGECGSLWNIGGDNEIRNIDLVYTLCDQMAALTGEDPDRYRRLVAFVRDRPGHDRRYSVDCGKIKNELGWKQSVNFEEGIRATIGWYLDNLGWVDSIRSGEYLAWMDSNYARRASGQP